MSIMIAYDGDRTVADISARNAITSRFDGLQVLVRDATGDTALGSGEAIYQWDLTGSKWLTVWSEHLINDAASNGKLYGRKNAAWVEVVIPTQVITSDVPAADNLYYARRNQAWIAITPYTEAPTDGKSYARNNTAWTAITSFPEAPTDGGYYTRRNSAWAAVSPFVEAPIDGKTYARSASAWVAFSTDVYSLKSSATVTTSTITVDPTSQQAIPIDISAARTIAFNAGTSQRMIMAVLVLVGTTLPTFSGTNYKWTDSTALTAADLGAVKTCIICFWDGIDTWILSRGPAY